MTYTRKQAKEAAMAIRTLVDVELDVRGHAEMKLMCDYLDQPPENPDVEVWEEIEGLLGELDELDGSMDHYVFSFNGNGNGFGAAKIPESCWLVDHDSNTLPKIRDILRGRLAADPALESEQAARKEAEEEIRRLESKIAKKDKAMKAGDDLITALQANVESLEERNAELESPVVLSQYQDKHGNVFRVAELSPPNEDTYGIHFAGWTLSDTFADGRIIASGLDRRFGSEREAQDALDEYAKEQCWQEVTT